MHILSLATPQCPKSRLIRSQVPRSVVVSTRGIVATEHPLASQAGAMVLAQGGHAVDAAIAANAVMGVVCPMMCGVGGDLFAIVCEHDGTMHGVNASGWAPARLTPEFLERPGPGGMPQSGVHSITVPGAVAGWSLLLERFGRMPLARVLEPAIALGRGRISGRGNHQRRSGTTRPRFCAKTPRRARVSARRAPARSSARSSAIADLAWTYRQIAASGSDAFYRGEIARRLIAGSSGAVATMTAPDLAEFRAQWAEPISTSYRGWDVFELPPNGAGIAALMMLNIIERFRSLSYGTTRRMRCTC